MAARQMFTIQLAEQQRSLLFGKSGLTAVVSLMSDGQTVLPTEQAQILTYALEHN